jgi:hypothetical protein
LFAYPMEMGVEEVVEVEVEAMVVSVGRSGER